MSANAVTICIFGPDMSYYFFDRPVYSISVYGYFVPLTFSFMVLGKALSNQPFRQVLLMVGLIILNDFSLITYYSVWACRTDDTIHGDDWYWYALNYFGTDLMNYLFFVWLYQWHHTYI